VQDATEIGSILIPPAAGVQGIVTNVSLSVLLSLRSRRSKTACPNFTEFYTLVLCVRGSPVL